MSNALGGAIQGWTAEKVRIVNAQHNLISSLPRRCNGKRNCSASGDCHFSNKIVNDEFAGTNCPIEVVESFKLFAGYVLDLDIKPEDFTDIQLVMDLVRLTLIARRCDTYNKSGDILLDETIMVVQKDGKEVKKPVPVPTFGMMREIREDIQKIYTMLVASREGKTKRDAMLKDTKGASDMFSQLRKVAEEAQLLAEKKNQKKLPIITAEYEIKEDNDNGEENSYETNEDDA